MPMHFLPTVKLGAVSSDALLELGHFQQLSSQNEGDPTRVQVFLGVGPELRRVTPRSALRSQIHFPPVKLFKSWFWT